MQNKLLLLSCCAPCSCAIIEKLAHDKVNFAVLFYNPNIYPMTEYQKRRNEQERLCAMFGIKFIELKYDNAQWLQCIKGFEHEPERGKRCDICFYMRLKRAATYAKENGFNAFSSVLGYSRYKNLEQVNAAAQRAAEEVGIAYCELEGRKDGMQERRAEMIKELNLYSQAYCGCVFSQKNQ